MVNTSGKVRFRVGSTVRDSFGKLGRVVRVPLALRMRRYVPVQFEGQAEWLLVKRSTLTLVRLP